MSSTKMTIAEFRGMLDGLLEKLKEGHRAVKNFSKTGADVKDINKLLRETGDALKNFKLKDRVEKIENYNASAVFNSVFVDCDKARKRFSRLTKLLFETNYAIGRLMIERIKELEKKEELNPELFSALIPLVRLKVREMNGQCDTLPLHPLDLKSVPISIPDDALDRPIEKLAKHLCRINNDEPSLSDDSSDDSSDDEDDQNGDGCDALMADASDDSDIPMEDAPAENFEKLKTLQVPAATKEVSEIASRIDDLARYLVAFEVLMREIIGVDMDSSFILLKLTVINLMTDFIKSQDW